MAKIKKKTQKDQMQTQEEIRTIAHGVAERYRANRTTVNTALTVVIVVLLGLAIYSLSKSAKEGSAGQMLDRAYAFYNPVGGSRPDYQQALQGFQEVARKYGGTFSGAVAQYLVGNTLAQMGRLEEALKEYESFLKQHAREKLLSGMVYQRMGYVYAAQGNQQEAIRSFSKAESLAGTGMATFELARIYERSGNSLEAQKKYKELSENLPATTLALEARTKFPPPDLKASPAGTPGTTGR
jgi:tetratricopeptide (TPR) repeat protein